VDQTGRVTLGRTRNGDDRPLAERHQREGRYAFNDVKAEDRHDTQYFEMFCNRGIYHKGWTAVTRHGVPWLGAYKRSFDEDVWELYDTNSDWTQAHDLAK
jgi:arylsulfatase A-like enzyme